jgi:threonine 3-dehydrogenase
VMGASRIIGIEPDPHHAALAKRLGCDAVLTPAMPPKEAPFRSDPGLRQQVLDLTDGIGVDVAMEMAGFNSALNNAIKITRRGGSVVLFGVKNGNAIIEDAHRIVMDGVQMHGVVGRRIFSTWDMTRNLLENRNNGIQDAVWDVILNQGQDTIVDIAEWEKERFEERIRRHPKVVIRFAG